MYSTKTYDVIVVGAGILGAAAFYGYCSHGLRVLLLEQVTIASATTADSGGLVHAYPHSTDLDYAINFYKNFFEHTGIELVTKIMPVQYYQNEKSWRDDNSFTVSTVAATRAFIEAGKREGGSVLEHTMLQKLTIIENRIKKVHTTYNTFSAGLVVLAMGARLPQFLSQEKIEHSVDISCKRFYYNYYTLAEPMTTAIVDMNNQLYAVPTQEKSLISGLLADDEWAMAPDVTETNYELSAKIDNLIRQHLAPQHAIIQTTNRYAYDSFNAKEIPELQPTAITNLWMIAGGSGCGFKYAPCFVKLECIDFVRFHVV